MQRLYKSIQYLLVFYQSTAVGTCQHTRGVHRLEALGCTLTGCTACDCLAINAHVPHPLNIILYYIQHGSHMQYGLYSPHPWAVPLGFSTV